MVTVNRPRQYLMVAAGAVLVALLVGSALVASRRQPDRYPAGSPEAAAQAYFQALIDQQPSEAHDLYSADLQARCDTPLAAFVADLSISRVVLDEVTVTGDRATVGVTVTQNFDRSPFSFDQSITDQTLTLARNDDDSGWLIDDEPWPWFPCRVGG